MSWKSCVFSMLAMTVAACRRSYGLSAAIKIVCGVIPAIELSITSFLAIELFVESLWGRRPVATAILNIGGAFQSVRMVLDELY